MFKNLYLKVAMAKNIRDSEKLTGVISYFVDMSLRSNIRSDRYRILAANGMVEAMIRRKDWYLAYPKCVMVDLISIIVPAII